MAKIAGGICDARYQLFHNEMIRNENTLRMKWFLRNQQQLIDNLREPKFIKQATDMIAESKKRKREKEKRIVKPIVRQKLMFLPHWRPPESDGPVNIDIMKPVNPNIRVMLYEKNIPTFIATNNYLTERYKEPPEKRFYFPDCTSWIYGWRLDDYPSVPLSKIGRKSVMLTQFYQRKAFNLQRDPEWYRGCQMKNTKNFNDLLIY